MASARLRYDPAEPVRRSLSADGGGNVLHTEKGEVLCRCPATGEERPMAFQGFEADWGTLKYRCPAAAYGLECQGRQACLRDAASKAGDYARVVRVDLATHDRRMFTPTPWGSPSWQRGYARRGALERINARLDNSFGFERHFVRRRAKMKARLGLALAVMMALGARFGGGGPPGADALAGGPGTAAGGVAPPARRSRRNRRRSRGSGARRPRKCEPFPLGGPQTGRRVAVGSPCRADPTSGDRRIAVRCGRRNTALPKNPTAQVPRQVDKA